MRKRKNHDTTTFFFITIFYIKQKPKTIEYILDAECVVQRIIQYTYFDVLCIANAGSLLVLVDEDDGVLRIPDE